MSIYLRINLLLKLVLNLYGNDEIKLMFGMNVFICDTRT
jgi:hypothetical protein